jgi:glycosyltransferase involved in cell wall biosynthesis
MRVSLLSFNAQAHDAIGNHVAETAAFFLDRGAALRVFVHSIDHLHPRLRDCAQPVDVVEPRGPVWDFLAGADLVIAQYSQACDLLHFLPLLAGGKPRLLLDYYGVTPAYLWTSPNREALEQSLRQRGIAWCADAVVAHSEFTRQELIAATAFPAERIRLLPFVVDRARFHPGQSRFLHQRLGLRDEALLLYVGRLAGNKRVPLLVDALVRLPARVHAVVIGDTGDVYAAEAQRCRARARERNVSRRLHLLGKVSDADLAEAYRSADVLVIPSRHEGFCVPVMEAMASGLPVVASRSAALPETVGDGGLTFAPDDAQDLARQVSRVLGSRLAISRGANSAPLSPRRATTSAYQQLNGGGKGVGGEGEPAGGGRGEQDVRRRERATITDKSARRRIAVVCFRFGAKIVGGAETSLRTIAHVLQAAGHDVEVFTTCTQSESNWHNTLAPGTTIESGLTVHRFPIDAHDEPAHLEAVRAIVEAGGHVTPEEEVAYLRHTIHSAALIDGLRQWACGDCAIITGPYLFGITCDVARAFPDRTLLLPCFHDEPIARLAVWPEVYGNVGGILLHSREEKDLMLERLGINSPNAVEIGTWIETQGAEARASGPRGYVVYCGRFSKQKNVPLLVEWMRRYQEERPGRIGLVCMGRGEVPLTGRPWLQVLGWTDEPTKHQILAGAGALVQLSVQESLSLVALEAWAQQTPVIVHRNCAVLARQVERSQGGVIVDEYVAFARALDDLADDPDAWNERGRRGRAYVDAHYASVEQFQARLFPALDNLDAPLHEQMRERGLQRAMRCDRAAWRESFGHIIESLLDAAPPPYRPDIEIGRLQDMISAQPGTRTTLVPVRIRNCGTHAALAQGPGRTLLCAETRDPRTGTVAGERQITTLPDLLVPGTAQAAMVLVPVPPTCGLFELHLWAEHPDGAQRRASEPIRIPLHVQHETAASSSSLAPLLDGIRQLLVRAREGQILPDDYLDVSEGWFARWKRWAKHKLLHNFKRAYVDVLSRRQSHINEQLVTATQQLAECCAMLDHAMRTLSTSSRIEAALPANTAPRDMSLNLAGPRTSQTHPAA